MNELIQTHEHHVLRYFQTYRFEDVVIDGRGAPRESSQRCASTKLSVLWKDMFRTFHIIVCRHKTCMYNTPMVSFRQGSRRVPGRCGRGQDVKSFDEVVRIVLSGGFFAFTALSFWRHRPSLKSEQSPIRSRDYGVTSSSAMI